MKNLEKMLMKQKDDSMDPEYKSSKMEMLKELKKQMMGLMGEDLKGHSMKKVEVAAPDSEGLEEGLEKAKEIVEGSEDESEDEMENEESSELNDDHFESMVEGRTPEEIDAMIKKLEMMKSKKSLF